MAEVTDSNPQLGLLGKVPAEIRHEIYYYVSLKDPSWILKEWFEHVDPDIDTSTAVNPPIAAEDDESDESGEADEDDDGGDESEDDEEEDEDMEDSDDEAESDEAMQDGEELSESEQEEEEEEAVDGSEDQTTATNTTAAATATTGTTATTVPSQPPQQRHTKYRHTVKMYMLDRAPPPVNLLLVSKQIQQEAYDYVYNTAGLVIDVTRGFAHFTFMEDTLQMLTDEDKTPLNHLKKVRVDFVWDSEWTRTNNDKINVELLVEMLRARCEVVKTVLLSMPNITDIKVTWHDTERTDQSLAVQTHITDMLLPISYGGDTPYFNKEGTDVNFTMEEAFEEPGTEYDADSRVGQLRLELEAILSGRVQIC